MTIAGYQDRTIDARSSWGWVLTYGILLAVVGILALVEPVVTGLITGLFVALILICGGVAGITAGVTARGWRSRWLDIAIGCLSLALGLLVAWKPLLGAITLVWWVGMWLLLCGCLEFAAGLRPMPHRGFLMALGITNALLGTFLMLIGPANALFILAAMIGFSFLLRGAFLCRFALHLRKLHQKIISAR